MDELTETTVKKGAGDTSGEMASLETERTGISAVIDRRTMLKAAVATGVIAGTWVAPRIESLGFAPAAAAGTPCVILSPSSDDQNQNLGQNDCPVPARPCCGQSFGPAGNQPDRFTFEDPVAGCEQIVVRTVTVDCDPDNVNPDVGQFGVIIESATGPNCGACRILDAVLIDSSQRTVRQSFNNGPLACDATGIDTSIPCNNQFLVPSSRLAVRLTCIVDDGSCTPTP